MHLSWAWCRQVYLPSHFFRRGWARRWYVCNLSRQFNYLMSSLPENFCHTWCDGRVFPCRRPPAKLPYLIFCYHFRNRNQQLGSLILKMLKAKVGYCLLLPLLARRTNLAGRTKTDEAQCQSNDYRTPGEGNLITALASHLVDWLR